MRMFSLLRRCIRRRNIGARKQTTNAAAMLVDKTFFGEWNSVFMPLITWLKTIYGIFRLLLLSSIISAPVFVDVTTPAADSTTAEFNKRRAEWKEINISNQTGNNENWSNAWNDPTQNSTKTELYSVTEQESDRLFYNYKKSVNTKYGWCKRARAFGFPQ